MFMKLPSSSAPPSGPVRCPAVVRRLDYEVELAVVMGAGGEIAGYAVADDVSARDLQRREPQWTRAKGADTFCPWGPWITTADEVPEPEDLRLTCHVNGELRQDSRTSDLIFGPRALVDFIAEAITLEPGDLILTGTPSGVGFAMDPPRFLARATSCAARSRGSARSSTRSPERFERRSLSPACRPSEMRPCAGPRPHRAARAALRSMNRHRRNAALAAASAPPRC